MNINQFELNLLPVLAKQQGNDVFTRTEPYELTLLREVEGNRSILKFSSLTNPQPFFNDKDDMRLEVKASKESAFWHIEISGNISVYNYSVKDALDYVFSKINTELKDFMEEKLNVEQNV